MNFIGDIARIEQAVEIGSVLSRCWFRGHDRIHGALVPGIFREPYASPTFRSWRPHVEQMAVAEFKRASPALAPSTPALDDDLGWLFLMQHHGTPTRLLDWTESVLVALHFAVSWSHDEDGELFAVFPEALNEASGVDGLPLSWEPAVQYLSFEAANGPAEEVASKLGLSEIPEAPIALLPPVSTARIRAQQAAFTIHPSPAGDAPIDSLVTDERHFARYRVPANRKWQLAQDLRALGILTTICSQIWTGFRATSPRVFTSLTRLVSLQNSQCSKTQNDDTASRATS